MKITIDRMLTV